MSLQAFLKQPLPSGFVHETEAEKFRRQAKSVKKHFTTRAVRAADFNNPQGAENNNKKARLAEIAEHYSIEKIYLNVVVSIGNNTRINELVQGIDNLKEEYYNLQQELQI